MKGIMRTSVLAVAAVSFAAPLAWAQTELLVGDAGSIQLPAKGRIDARDGSLRMVFKVYDRERGGAAVYQEAQSVKVSRGVYFAMVGSKPSRGVSTEALRSHGSLWVEATVGGRAVGERQAYLLTSEADAASEEISPATPAIRGHAGLCFTCGGGYTRFSGSFQDASGQPVEYGSACSGSNPITRTDSRPFLCSRAR